MTSCEAGPAIGRLGFLVANASFQVSTVFEALPANEELPVRTAHDTDIKSSGVQNQYSHLCVCMRMTYICYIHGCHVDAAIYVCIFIVYTVQFIYYSV